MKPILNLEELQEQVGLLENDKGIVYLSLFNTDLYDLLQPYIETTDYRLYFDYSNRIVIGKYQKALSASKVVIIQKAIYYALKGEEYNLRTLIDSTNLEYNPLENYEISEEIITSTTVSATQKIGEIKNIGNEITTPYNTVVTTTYGSKTANIKKSMPEISEKKQITNGAQHDVVTQNTTNTIGQQTESTDTVTTNGNKEINTVTTSNIGARNNTVDTENKVSAYNTTTYQPNNTSNVSNNTQAAIDSENKKETSSQYTNDENSTKTIDEHTTSSEQTTDTAKDAQINIETFTRNAREDEYTNTYSGHTDKERRENSEQKISTENTTNEHTNQSNNKSDENKNRHLHGRYGFNTVQTMIESERRLANLNITDKLIDIIIHTICEGVLYLW